MTNSVPRTSATAAQPVVLVGTVGDRRCELISIQGLRRNVGQPVPLKCGAVLTIQSTGAWICRIPAAVANGDADLLESVTYSLMRDGEQREGVLSVGRRRNLPEPVVEFHGADDQPKSGGAGSATVKLKIVLFSGSSSTIDLPTLIPNAQPDRPAILLDQPSTGRAIGLKDGQLSLELPTGTTGNLHLTCLLEDRDRKAIPVEITVDAQRSIEIRDTLRAREPSADAGIITLRVQTTDDRMLLHGDALPGTRVACQVTDNAERSARSSAITDETGRWVIRFAGLIPGAEYSLQISDANGIATTYGGLQINEHQLQGAVVCEPDQDQV